MEVNDAWYMYGNDGSQNTICYWTYRLSDSNSQVTVLSCLLAGDYTLIIVTHIVDMIALTFKSWILKKLQRLQRS